MSLDTSWDKFMFTIKLDDIISSHTTSNISLIVCSSLAGNALAVCDPALQVPTHPFQTVNATTAHLFSTWYVPDFGSKHPSRLRFRSHMLGFDFAPSPISTPCPQFQLGTPSCGRFQFCTLDVESMQPPRAVFNLLPPPHLWFDSARAILTS